MPLSDLPIDILARVLPIEKHLVDLPHRIRLPWLNLMPQKQCFRILAESGIGAFKRHGKNRDRLRIVSIPETSKDIDIGNFTHILTYWAQLNAKFFCKIFINFGDEQNLRIKYHKEYIIFNYTMVKDLVIKYVGFLSKVYIWIGRNDIQMYSFMCFWVLKSRHRRHSIVSVQYPLIVDANSSEALVNFSKNLLQQEYHSFAIQQFRRIFFSWIRVFELTMSIHQYLEIKLHLIKSDSRHHLKPEFLLMYLTHNTELKQPHGSHVGPKSDLFLDFQNEWITDVFTTTQVKEFTLDYFSPQSTFYNFINLLPFIPNVSVLNLSFGILEFFNIPRVVLSKPFDLHIQARVDKQYYESVQYIYARTIWNTEIFDDCVVLSCIKCKE